MLKHIRPKLIQGEATRPRPEAAGSIRDGAAFRQAGVADGLWGTTPRRRPLLTLAKIRSRHDRKMNLNRP